MKEKREKALFYHKKRLRLEDMQNIICNILRLRFILVSFKQHEAMMRSTQRLLCTEIGAEAESIVITLLPTRLGAISLNQSTIRGNRSGARYCAVDRLLADWKWLY